ncbi:helix-turn-helix domain-containing protein [Rathayibacter sp. VKM Ac-2803]|uniref:IclR family transcriptional regulator n=1 Tax=unclassified Rathayibacter TaxID=2609250 RepID=UPI00135A44CA|nr:MULTISPECIES: IclR family transcriptional regulator [unclassified Rathayibacter]MWV48564.1 helix-turn-helix domain-containing protein [Rathayibacter sp. VKM Ac-2803]MWV60098.1 helix-turn-helix domain-containing protein [Rathayibacter sp. VKM Ac-2754]
MAEEAGTRTVDRALALLAVICDRGSATLAESARATDLPASTALRLLRTLEGSGFVRRDEDGTFRPGSRLVQLGAQALSSESLVTLARPVMEDLVEETGESVYLSIEGHRETALYISIVEGTHSVRHASWVGRAIPLDGSAAGAVLRGETPDQGFVVVQSGIEPDVTAIAAPVHAGARIIAAMSLVVPSYRERAVDEMRHGIALVRAARLVSSGVGGAG